MLKSRIIELLDTIPLKSKIYAEAKPVDSGASTSDVTIHRRACALLDPPSHGNYAQAFVQLRWPLPSLVYEPYIKMAYDHLSSRTINDDINGALLFQHPRWITKRGFLEALLLLPALRLDEVAKHVGIPVSHSYGIRTAVLECTRPTE